jgi:hypothetical protein
MSLFEPLLEGFLMYDSRCLDLAEYFLADERNHPDYADLTAELAQRIQDAVEDFIVIEQHARPLL